MDLHNLVMCKSAILFIFKYQKSTAAEDSGELLSLWFIHLPSSYTPFASLQHTTVGKHPCMRGHTDIIK